MPKSASRSLRSWLKSADSENSPPNALINKRPSVTEKDKTTSPTTHATPGKRITRSSQMDAIANTPVKTPLRNTRRSSISENDNKLPATPLRRSARKLSQTLEDVRITPTISRGKSVLIIDSPIKEENENSEVSTPASRNGRKNDKIKQAKNDVNIYEKTGKMCNSKSYSVGESPDSDLIIIIDDDDDVGAAEGIKKFNTPVNERNKIDDTKKNTEGNQTELIISQFVCKYPSPKECVHGNTGIVSENKITTIKDEITVVNAEEICKEKKDVTEHDSGEVIEAFKIQEEEVINVNEKQGDENDEKRDEEFQIINENQKNEPLPSENQGETEEQREITEQKNFVEINLDIELNNLIKNVNEKNNTKEVDFNVNPFEIENISENEKFNDVNVETIITSSPLSSTEHKITTIISDKKRNNESLDENFTLKESRETTNSFDQFSFNLEKGKSEIILNEEESEINTGSFKKVKPRNNNSKIHKSVTFDNTKEQSSIKYPTTPKGKSYSDPAMFTLENIDPSCEASGNFNASGSFKDSEDNDKNQQMSFNVEMCNSATDCDTPYKNLSEVTRVSSSTPLSILKKSHKKNDGVLNDSNKLNADLIIKEKISETDEPELFPNVINLNAEDKTKDISVNSINEKELKNTKCELSQSCKELVTENVKDNTNKDFNDCDQKHHIVKTSLSTYFVSSGSQSDDEYESDKEKNIEEDKDETKTAEKDTLQFNYGTSNLIDLTNLAHGKSTKEIVLGNEENYNRNRNLEIKNGNDSKEDNIAYFKDISKNGNDHTPVINEGKVRNINLEQEIYDTESILSTTDNQKDREKKTKELSAYLKISSNNEEIQNATEISKNTDKLLDNSEITEMTLNTSNKKTSIQGDSENMNSKFQNSEGIFTINNDSDLTTKRKIETSKDPKCLNIENEIEEVEFLNILKQDANTDNLKDISSEGNNDVETEKEVLVNDLDISELQKLPEEKNDVLQIKKTLKDSEVIKELLITENIKIFDFNLEDKDLSTDSCNSSISSNSVKSFNLNITTDKSISSAIPDEVSPKIKNKNLVKNKNGQKPLVPFAENNVNNIVFEECKVPEVNKSKTTKTRSPSPVYSLNKTFTPPHHLEIINECCSDEVNENNSNKELSNKSTTLQTKESEIKIIQKMKRLSSPVANEEKLAPKCTKYNLSCEGTSKIGISENMNKNDNLENNGKKTKKLSKCSNDINYKPLLVLDANSNKSTHFKKTQENTDSKVSQSKKSVNSIQTINSAKKPKQQSKVKVGEKRSKVIIDQENISPTSTGKKLKKKLNAEIGEQSSLKVKQNKLDIIQSNASGKSMEKKLYKRNAKEKGQTTVPHSTLHQKQFEEGNGKTEMEMKSTNNSKKLKDRFLPDEILVAIDKPLKKSKERNFGDLEETKKSQTESSNEDKLSQDLFRYSTSGGISDIIKNPSGIFFEEPITPHKKNGSKSFNNEKRKILSTIELSTGIVYEEPVTPDHKKIINGFKETKLTPRAIGFKVKKVLSAGQKEPPVYKKDTHKKRKLLLDEPSMVLPKPKWATSEFNVTKFPRAINLDESIATEFLVTPLQSKKSRAEAELGPLTASAAYEFKKNALYNKQIPRQTSRQILQCKEKQKY